MKAPQPYIAPRTCTEAEAGKSKAEAKLTPQSLEEHSDEGAYVLLAPPGSGKTSEFRRQAKLCDGQFVSARDFIAFEDNSEWHGRTLFIDGLDEVRAGSADGRTSFDGIRKKLLQLGKPRFRLSCREADWFGSNDRQHLETVAPEGKVLVLRLDPLPEEEIKAILRKNHNIDDPDAFVDKARQRSVAALLENPLSLELLVKAVMKNEWPDSRIRTFEMACETLADETNEEHQYAKIRERANTTVLLNAAGQLCAVLLLAGAPGIQLSARSQDDNFIELNELTGTGRALQLESLKTRLFEAPNSEFAIPLHRQVAEYLGACYLAELVENGLPVNRILALMSGYDGMVVTELRGLCAWLATHSPVARELIINRDPLGVVLYGDVSGFPLAVKQRILRELEKVFKKDGWLIATIKFDSRLGDLVSSELTSEILAILENPARDEGRQSLTLFLIEALCHAYPLEGISCVLMKIIRDGSRWLSIRQKVIDAFLSQQRDKSNTHTELKKLMKDIINGKVLDSDNDLLGRLLDATYPSVLPGTEVLNYLRETQSNPAYSYQRFWMWKIFEQANCTQIANLLDQLASRYQPQQQSRRKTGQRAKIPVRVPLILLDGFISRCSEMELEPQRMFGWLGVAGRVGDWNQDLGYLHQQRDRIRSWLVARPELWKSILEIGLKYCVDASQHSDESDFQKLMWMEEDRRLFGTRRPLDFGSWCLDKAVTMGNSEAADWLIRRVADAVDDEGISRNLVDSRIDGRDFLKSALEKRLSERKQFKSWERKQVRSECKEENKEKREFSRWKIAVNENRRSLIENNAPEEFLHKLAIAYFGGYHGMTEYTPVERLSELLGNDEQLVETTLIGLRRVIMRQDLPSIEDVVKLAAEDKIQYLWFPFLAGFNELYKVSQNNDSIHDDQIELALALFFNVSFWPNPWGTGDDQLQPAWLQPVLRKKPRLAANILIDSIIAKLRKRKDVSHRLYEFSYEEDYREIARLASLPILEATPVRCTKQQLYGLRYLFIAAHRYSNREEFIELISKKLSFRSMSVVARVYWHAAGFFASPAEHFELLQRYVRGNKRRITYLADFIGGRFESGPGQSENISAFALSSLILLLGTAYPPRSFTSDVESDAKNAERISGAMDISFRIDNFISQLMSDSSPKASKELERLAEEVDLASWRSQIQYAVNRQRNIRREAYYQHADVPTILSVLQNRHPANAADLAALTMDLLNELASKIRHGNTSDWRQYWERKSNRLIKPEHENACRDRLLSDLEQRLTELNIDALAEGNYADEKRADIRVCFSGYNIPIEIKRSCHRDLWTAIRTQLIAKYTRDPGADGNGIYLVFWFGNHEQCRPTPDAGPPPKSAEELKRRLEDSLIDAERRKISVCVIDVEDRKNQVELDSISHE